MCQYTIFFRTSNGDVEEAAFFLHRSRIVFRHGGGKQVLFQPDNENIPELQALLDADKELMNDFIRYAARNGVQPDYKDIARSRKLIEALLRAYIGRNTPLNEAGFYVNIYPIDPVMLRAVEVLKTQNDHD